MFRKYHEILALPGALKFSLTGLFARFPMALVGISMIIMVRTLYGSYSLAGLVSGISVISFAIGTPLLSRQVDSHGQALVMIPSIIASAAATVGMIFAALFQAPVAFLLPLAVVAGAFSGSMGSLVRARWAHVTTHPGQIQVAYSLESAFDELAFVIGPVIATLLSTAVHPTAGMWLAVTINLSGGLWFLSQKSTEPPPRPKHHPANLGGPIMLNPAMIVLALTYVGAGALFGANDLSVIAFSSEQGMGGISGVLLGVFALGSLFGALVYGARSWRWPLWKLYAVGVVCLAIGASTFVLASTLWILAIIMAVTGLVVAPTMTNVNTIVERIMPSGRLTEGLAWMSTSMNLGVSMGAGISGRIIDLHGAHAGFLVVIASAWFMVVATLAGLKFLRRETEKPRKWQLGQ